MKLCKKCNSEFAPCPGLINYCSLSCRNSRGPRSEADRKKISDGLRKKLPYIEQLNAAERKEWARSGGIARGRKYKQNSEIKIQSFPWEELTNKEKRERIFREQDGRCSECRIEPVWNNKVLKFELDHINGISSNDSRENLRLVCPNCHSQTETYKVGNNKNPGKTTYSDEIIIDSLMQSPSAYRAMKRLGMNPHGGNYTRLRRIVIKYDLKLNYSF